MTEITGGYDGPDPEPPKRPEEGEWLADISDYVHSTDKTSVYVSIRFNGKSLGMIRCPSMEHVKWLKDKIQK